MSDILGLLPYVTTVSSCLFTVHQRSRQLKRRAHATRGTSSSSVNCCFVYILLFADVLAKMSDVDDIIVMMIFLDWTENKY